jgi:hypothetical protein
MIRIAISQAAFDALAATLPLGSVGYENQTNQRGERLIWVDPTVVNRLRAMREIAVAAYRLPRSLLYRSPRFSRRSRALL